MTYSERDYMWGVLKIFKKFDIHFASEIVENQAVSYIVGGAQNVLASMQNN